MKKLHVYWVQPVGAEWGIVVIHYTAHQAKVFANQVSLIMDEYYLDLRATRLWQIPTPERFVLPQHFDHCEYEAWMCPIWNCHEVYCCHWEAKRIKEETNRNGLEDSLYDTD